MVRKKNEIRISGCYKVVSELKLTDLKARLKDCKKLRTQTDRPKDSHGE